MFIRKDVQPVGYVNWLALRRTKRYMIRITPGSSRLNQKLFLFPLPASSVQTPIVKCDLCEGDPECVKYCIPEALKFEEPSDEVRSRMEKTFDLIKKELLSEKA